jgi:hypothetical protein
MRLEQALQGCSVGLLRKIASARGVPVDVTTLRTELLERIAADLISSSRHGGPSARLTEEERLAVSLVASSGGRQGAKLLVRRLVSRLGSAFELTDAEALLDGLTEQGILFRLFDSSPGVRGTVYELPDELGELVTAIDREGASFLERAASSEPREVRQNDPCSDLFLLLSALRRELWNAASAKISGRRPRTVSQLLSRLESPVADVGRVTDRKRWTFFLGLARQAGLVNGRIWPVPLEDEVLDALADRRRLQRELWNHYAATPRGSVRDRGSGEHFQNDVLALISQIPAGDWFPVEEFITAVLRELGLPDGAARPGPGESLGAPGADLRSRLRRLLTGPWYWLGVVRWGNDGDDWSRVSTTDRLGPALGRPPNDAGPPVARACSVVGDLELEAPLSADLGLLFRAETYLSSVGGIDPRRYRLTAASFARGIRLGGTGLDACRCLEGLIEGALPRAWTDALSKWEESFGDVNVAAALLLAASDGAKLDRLSTLEGVQQALFSRIGERHAEVRPEKLSTLLSALSDNGRSCRHS